MGVGGRFGSGTPGHAYFVRESVKRPLSPRCAQLEVLELRRLLSSTLASVYAHSTLEKYEPVAGVMPYYSAPQSWMFTPTTMRKAYGIDQITFSNGTIPGDGTGQTVAIVDAYDNPSFVSTGSANFNSSDLHKFDVQFGLADPVSFQKVNQR